MNLSERLNKIINMVRPCILLADIGCDHGYVCIRAVQNGQAAAAIASDVAEGPLQIASDNIRAAGLEDRIITVLADGLEGIPADARPDCIVMTGMGGLLMRRILQTLSKAGTYSENRNADDAVNEDRRFSALSQLVLGPQSDIDTVRHYLIDTLHYVITREVTVLDEGKFYTLLDVQPQMSMIRDTSDAASDAYSECEYMYGKNIDTETSDVYRAYLEQQKQILTDAYHGALRGCSYGAAEAIRDIKHRLMLVEEAQNKLQDALVQGKEPSR